MGECIVGGLGGSDWKLVDEWSITGGSVYTGTQYTGNFNDFRDYDKVRIAITGNLTGYRYDGSSGTAGYLSLYNGRREIYQQPNGSTTKTYPVNIVSDFLIIRTDDNPGVIPMGSKSNGSYPGTINAVVLQAVSGAEYISASGLTVKVYAK